MAGAVLLALSHPGTAAAALLVLAVLMLLALRSGSSAALDASAALVIWQRLFDGRLPQVYVENAAGRPWWLLVTAGAGFSLLNAAGEEAIFRGVLQTALERVSGPVVGIVVQAVAFGALHVVGLPTGIVGAVMAGG